MEKKRGRQERHLRLIVAGVFNLQRLVGEDQA